MVSTTVLVNLLLAAATLATPSLETRLKHRVASRQLNNPQLAAVEASVDHDVTHASASYTENRAGAAYTNASLDTFTAVSGVFTVPNLTGSGSATVWVGIDSDTCITASLQIGVDINVFGEQVILDAWSRWSPDPMQFFTSVTIKVGDVVGLAVAASSLNSGNATININGHTFFQDFKSASALCGQEAGWIVEDMKRDLDTSFLPFTNFGTIVFTDAIATTHKGILGPGGAILKDIRQNNQILTSSSVNSSSVTVHHL